MAKAARIGRTRRRGFLNRTWDGVGGRDAGSGVMEIHWGEARTGSHGLRHGSSAAAPQARAVSRGLPASQLRSASADSLVRCKQTKTPTVSEYRDPGSGMPVGPWKMPPSVRDIVCLTGRIRMHGQPQYHHARHSAGPSRCQLSHQSDILGNDGQGDTNNRRMRLVGDRTRRFVLAGKSPLPP